MSSTASRPWIPIAVAWLSMAVVAAIVVQFFRGDVEAQSHLVNASSRGFIGGGTDSLVSGFVIAEHPQTVVVRALGPSLSRFGLRPLARPLLRVVEADSGRQVASNAGWRTPANQRLSGDLRRYAPTNPDEAACILRLPPGAYSAIVQGDAPESQGVAVVEIYEVDR